MKVNFAKDPMQNFPRDNDGVTKNLPPGSILVALMF